jgi:DNA-binding response OmpR family regulator
VPGLQKILLVEDNLALRGMYYDYLQAHGFDVHVAVDGRNALDVVKDFRPELIFLDIMMPELNGFDVVLILRSDATYNAQKTKIVLLSNLGEDKVPANVESAIDGYALKAGIKLTDLLEIIHSFESP